MKQGHFPLRVCTIGLHLPPLTPIQKPQEFLTPSQEPTCHVVLEATQGKGLTAERRVGSALKWVVQDTGMGHECVGAW